MTSVPLWFKLNTLALCVIALAMVALVVLVIMMLLGVGAYLETIVEVLIELEETLSEVDQ